MIENQRGRYMSQLARSILLLTLGFTNPVFCAESANKGFAGTYGDWDKGCQSATCNNRKFLMGGLVKQKDKCIYLYWEQNINSGHAQYFSTGFSKGNELYVSGDVFGEQCKAVFQVRNNVLSYVEAKSDQCMNNLGMGAYLSTFESVRVSREQTPPRDADQSYRSAKWRAAWKEASKQCPASH